MKWMGTDPVKDNPMNKRVANLRDPLAKYFAAPQVDLVRGWPYWF